MKASIFCQEGKQGRLLDTRSIEQILTWNYTLMAGTRMSGLGTLGSLGGAHALSFQAPVPLAPSSTHGTQR